MEYLELQDVLPGQLPHEERGGHAHQRNVVSQDLGSVYDDGIRHLGNAATRI